MDDSRSPHVTLALQDDQNAPRSRSSSNIGAPLVGTRPCPDEGYSGEFEETRSTADEDGSMQIDAMGAEAAGKSLTGQQIQGLDMPERDRSRAIIALMQGMDDRQKSFLLGHLTRSLSQEWKADLASQLLSDLPTSHIAGVVDSFRDRLHINPVDKLPAELTEQIFFSLGPNDLIRASMASRKWRERALESNVWRTMFGREGWLFDNDKLRSRVEIEMARRAARSRPHRRKLDSEIETNGSRKRQRESPDRRSLPTNAADTRDWNEQHGSVEADDDHDMEGTESLAAGEPSVSGLRDFSPVSTRTESDQPSDHPPLRSDVLLQHDLFQTLQPPVKPSLFDGNAAHAKVDWLYLYKQRRRLEQNWQNGRYATFQLPRPEHLEDAHDECVYTIQYTGNYLVSGSRDKTIKIWELESRRCIRTLKGQHDQSVLCLQFDADDDIIVSGGSDSYVIIWKFSTGEVIRKMTDAHTESVLNLRFDHRYLITCSKDKTIKIWNRHQIAANDPIIPAAQASVFQAHGVNFLNEYSLLATLVGHNAAVNAIQVFEGQIVSASGDRTIRMWDIDSQQCLKQYSGHTKGIACVQFDGRRIVSGSSDNTVRIFDAATAAEVACLSGHTNLVRTVQARFGDLLESDQELESQAREIDQRYFTEFPRGPDARRSSLRASRNAGSSDPRHLAVTGAKIPPGGGGNRWSRIVSGSYDETVIIWKKDHDGKWIASRRLHQDEILNHPRNSQRARQAQHRHLGPQMPQVPLPGPHHAAIPNAGPQWQPPPPGPHPQTQAQTQQPPQQPAMPNQPHQAPNAGTQQNALVHPMTHPIFDPRQLLARRMDDSNRVFKLQFDCRRIVCCSQNRMIVGWDFANSDTDLEEASRFFAESN